MICPIETLAVFNRNKKGRVRNSLVLAIDKYFDCILFIYLLLFVNFL
jgi:hypothetical protein